VPYVRVRFEEYSKARLEARDSAYRKFAGRFYSALEKNDHANMINADFTRVATRGHGQSEFDRALREILDLSGRKVLGRRQILNILCGNPTPPKKESS
jgi:hypothetical protein